MQLCLASVVGKPNQFVTVCERQLRRAREPVHKGWARGVQPGINRQRPRRQHAACAFSNWLPVSKPVMQNGAMLLLTPGASSSTKAPAH